MKISRQANTTGRGIVKLVEEQTKQELSLDTAMKIVAHVQNAIDNSKKAPEAKKKSPKKKG